MSWQFLGRRTVLGATVAGLCAPLLGACTSTAEPGPGGVPKSMTVPPECATLADYEFQRDARYCTPGPRGRRGGGPGSQAPIDHNGPLTITEAGLVAYYINGIVEWDANGEPVRLLAPQRADSFVYATRGALTVNPRCDGTLVVHTDGCAVGELAGHAADHRQTPSDGIQGLCWVDDEHLVSLGVDNTLRSWRVADAQELTVQTLASKPAGRTLGFEPITETLVVAGPAEIETFDATTLAATDQVDGLPESAVPWTLTPTGQLVGISADDANRGVLIRDPASGEIEHLSRNNSPKAITVAPSGLLAIANGYHLVLREPSGAVTELALEQGAYHATAMAFSADESQLHLLDAVDGIQTVDVATGEQVTTYRTPGR